MSNLKIKLEPVYLEEFLEIFLKLNVSSSAASLVGTSTIAFVVVVVGIVLEEEEEDKEDATASARTTKLNKFLPQPDGVAQKIFVPRSASGSACCSKGIILEFPPDGLSEEENDPSSRMMADSIAVS